MDDVSGADHHAGPSPRLRSLRRAAESHDRCGCPLCHHPRPRPGRCCRALPETPRRSGPARPGTREAWRAGLVLRRPRRIGSHEHHREASPGARNLGGGIRPHGRPGRRGLDRRYQPPGGCLADWRGGDLRTGLPGRLRSNNDADGHVGPLPGRIVSALFVAADIDLATFTRAHLPVLSDVAVRTQVYLSEDDWALKVAAFFARASRIGRPRLDELTREDLETLASNERLVGIDVTGVPGAHELRGMRGHGYWVANQRVST